MSNDPMTEYVQKTKKQLIDQINNEYADILFSISQVLSDEEQCLNQMLGKFTFPMAFCNLGLELNRKDLAYLGFGKIKTKHGLWLWHIRDEEGRKLLEWRIRRHAKMLAWLENRKDRKIRMLG